MNGKQKSGKFRTSADLQKYLRPVLLANEYKLIIFEVPHDKVLGKNCQTTGGRKLINSAEIDFSQEPPPLTTNQGQGRRYRR